MNLRINQVRKRLEKTQKEFGESLGVSRDTFASYESGRVEPSKTFIQLLCSMYNVNEHWLRTGEGEMFNEYDSVIDEINECYFDLDEQERAFIRTFINVKKEDRQAVMRFVTEIAKQFANLKEGERINE